MKRAALLIALEWVLLGIACAHGPLTADAHRDVIHGRHSACLAHVESLQAARRSTDALGAFQCDADAERECLAAHLERQCSQWQSGGL